MVLQISNVSSAPASLPWTLNTWTENTVAYISSDKIQRVGSKNDACAGLDEITSTVDMVSDNDIEIIP